LARPAPRQSVQGAHDGDPVQVLCWVVQRISERVMQGADSFSGTAGSLAEMKPVPIKDPSIRSVPRRVAARR
jgi:hypothetical protein